MTSLRHIALGCCVLSALAGILRLFWPENGFKSVINAVLVLYILTVGVQLPHKAVPVKTVHQLHAHC